MSTATAAGDQTHDLYSGPEQIAIEHPEADRGDIREAWQRATEMADDGHTRQEIRSELAQNLSLQGAVLTVVIAGATAYAGINVMSSMGESMSLQSGDMFYNSSEALQNGINDFFTQLPTVFVVIALVLVIGYLTIIR